MGSDSGDPDSAQDIRAKQKAELERAKQAALAGDATVFVEALFNSRLPDALTWRLRSQLPEDDVAAVIAEGITSAYAALRDRGDRIDLGSWLSKVCYNKTRARYASRKKVTFLEPADLERESVRRTPFTPPDLQFEQAEHEETAARRRIEAIQIARNLLPRIGEDNIQRVMSVVLDAVEQGSVDLSYSEIADAVGLTEATVQRLVSRGFERLEREAKRDGLWLDLSDVLPVEQEDPY
jgi:RNA polymerase sigma factor (sigma-70 family)